MRLILVGDTPGILQLLRHIPREHCIALVGAHVRPQYLSELKKLSERLRVPFFIQPKFNSPEYLSFIQLIRSLHADLIWVNSYSMIIRDDFLEAVHYGGINIHPSLLPRNRGCNPVQWGIINGDTEGGVSLHQITSGIDEGPIIDQKLVTIEINDDWMTVSDRIIDATDTLISSNVHSILSGNWTSVPQVASKATYCKRRTANDSIFDWTMPVIDIYNHIRALLPPLPSAFYINYVKQKVLISEFLALQDVTSMKYGEPGLKQLQSECIGFQPLESSYLSDYKIFLNFCNFHPFSPAIHNTFQSQSAIKSNVFTGTISADVSFLIFTLTNHCFIGFCHLRLSNWRHPDAELQIFISPDTMSRQSLYTEAVRLILRFLAEDFNGFPAFASFPNNDHQAIHSYQKAGFLLDHSCSDKPFIDSLETKMCTMRQERNDQ